MISGTRYCARSPLQATGRARILPLGRSGSEPFPRTAHPLGVNKSTLSCSIYNLQSASEGELLQRAARLHALLAEAIVPYTSGNMFAL